MTIILHSADDIHPDRPTICYGICDLGWLDMADD